VCLLVDFVFGVLRTDIRNLAYNLPILGSGYIYSAPTVANQNGCRCNTVYYSLLSGCGYCQGGEFYSLFLFQHFTSRWLICLYQVDIFSKELYEGLCHGVSVKLFAARHILNSLLVSYPEQIPVGVFVPAYAYQNVSVLYFGNGLQNSR
jgi:hypothetical protein